MTLFDWYAGGLNVIIVALFEVCGVAWIYGALYELTFHLLTYLSNLLTYTTFSLLKLLHLALQHQTANCAYRLRKFLLSVIFTRDSRMLRAS